MKKLIFYKANEYWSIPPEDIVYIKADGNYSKFILLSDLQNGKEGSFTLTCKLGHIDDILTAQLKAVGITGIKFVRLYKRVIVNLSYIHHINPSKRELILSDGKTFTIDLVKELNKNPKDIENIEERQGKNKKISKETLSEFKNTLENNLPYEVRMIMQEESEDKREKIIKKLYER